MDASDSRIPASSSTTSNWGRAVLFLGSCPCSLGSFHAVTFADGRGRKFGRRQFDQEARADRKIVFDVNCAAVLGDNARGDGEAEASAAIFCGEMREEEAVFVLG